MDIWQTDKLILFLIFILPGFISIKIYDLLIPGDKRDFSKSIIELIAYSSLNFIVLYWLINFIQSNNFHSQHPYCYFLALIFIMLIAPIFWAILFAKLPNWNIIANHIIHPVAKPWDYFFGQKQETWVIAHLTDGRKIGGKFDTNSFASSYPAEEQLYLAEVWKLDEDGNFIEKIPYTNGILIMGKEILAVEFKNF